MTTEIAQVQSVFITGLNTAVGQALALRLRAAGHTVAGVVTSSDEAAYFRRFGVTPAYAVLTRAGELRSAIQGTAATILVNCAAQEPNHVPHISTPWDTPLADYAEALEEAAAITGAEYLLHTSFTFAGGHLTEENEGAEDIVHAAQAAEAIALSASAPSAVIRFGYTYGPTDKSLVALREALRIGRPLDAGEEHVPAAWTYASDAAAALVKAIEKRVTDVTLDVVDDRPQPPAEFVRMFARMQGLGVPGRVPLFFRRVLSSEVQRQIMKIETHPSNAAAREALDWAPRFHNIEAGIDDLLLQWRAAMVVQA
ncbi:MAG: NAD(P)-dependent oxidoreductase [Anaerolineae bacterium]